jgi:hypothetical protein
MTTPMSDDPKDSSASSAPSEPYLLLPLPSRHVEESRRLIRAAAEEVQPGRAIVLGAGNCAEIPLAELVARFEQLTLNDVDGTLLEQGIAAAGLDAAAQAKIDVRVADLTGVTDPIIEKIEAVLGAISDLDTAVEQMATIVDEEQPTNMPIEGQFDLVVASCVLSQLHFGLAHRSGERFERRFAGQVERLRQCPRWTTALYQMARRMEARFIDGVAALSAQGGLIYLSESPQMCSIKLTADGRWETEGTYRMLRTQDLTDYADRRFAIVAHGRWHWVVSPPQDVGQVGRLFDVQALVLKKWRR